MAAAYYFRTSDAGDGSFYFRASSLSGIAANLSVSASAGASGMVSLPPISMQASMSSTASAQAVLSGAAAALSAALSAHATAGGVLTDEASAPTSVGIKLYASPLNRVPLPGKALRAWTRYTEGDAPIDGGLGGLDVYTDGAGILAISGLSILPGDGILTLLDPLDPHRSRNLRVTFS